MVQVSVAILLPADWLPDPPSDLGFPQEFGIDKSIDEPGGAYDNWIQGLVDSIPYLSAPLM
jgi:hypothetical protein